MRLKASLILLLLGLLFYSLAFGQSAAQPTGPLTVSTADGGVSFRGVTELQFPADQVRINGRKAIVFTKYGLVAADIPALDAAKITSGIFNTARLGSGTANSSTFLRGDSTWAAPPVTSVFGRTGAVVAQANDYSWAQIDKSTSSLADITTRSASDLSSGTLPAGRMPALTGDVTTSAGAVATTLTNSSTARSHLGLGTSDNAQFAKVGIGISPSDPLHLSSTVAQLAQFSSTNAVPYIYINTTAHSHYLVLGARSTGALIQHAIGSELRVEDSSGGLGTLVTGKLRTDSSTPASASAACTTGTITWDSSFVYVCVSTNTWKRSALSTW